MKGRGRVSADSQALTVVTNLKKRPEPPEGLPHEQAEIWRQTVASEVVDFFSTAALKAMLKDYCRHVHTTNILTAQIDAFHPDWLRDDDGLKRYEKLLTLRDREARAAADKATKLRLTNQSRYTPQAAATAAKHGGGDGEKPWEFEGSTA